MSRFISALLVTAALATGMAIAAPASPASAAVTLCDVSLRIGDSGDCVRKLQRRLNELGLDCGNELAVDGQFGSVTRMRVFAFQGRNRLEVHGIVGVHTRAKLANPDERLGVSCPGTIADRIRAIWPDASEEKAIRVARCESGLNPIAVGGPNSNGTLDFGVFQFNDGGTLQGYLPGANLAAKTDNSLHSDDNIHAALALFRDRGWQPWACGDA
ncbi:MAG TPA: peptidoglycan-binding protein [Candidatus Limnocylindrales bacterium]